MKMIQLRFVLPIFLTLCFSSWLIAQKITYKIGETTYILGEYYQTTGQPKVQRSSSAKSDFLKRYGYNSPPSGFEVDHIIPLSQGGADEPWNMQLLSIEQHRMKTASERSNSILNTSGKDPYNRASNFNIPKVSGSLYPKILHSGSRGGTFYYNSRGNKTYLKNN